MAAEEFVPLLDRDWPEFVEEMKGKSTFKLKPVLVLPNQLVFRNWCGSGTTLHNGSGNEFAPGDIYGPRSRRLHFLCMEDG